MAPSTKQKTPGAPPPQPKVIIVQATELFDIANTLTGLSENHTIELRGQRKATFDEFMKALVNRYGMATTLHDLDIVRKDQYIVQDNSKELRDWQEKVEKLKVKDSKSDGNSK